METKENIMLAFEREVYKLISMCLSENETLLFDEHFNFCAPLGVKQLEWEQGTCIVVKYQLMPYSFERIKYNFDMNSPRRLIVIFLDERDIPVNLIDTHIPITRPIVFLPYGKLFKKVESLNLLGLGDSEEEVAATLDRLDRKFTIGIEENNLVKAKKALNNDTVSLFLGAGVSISAGIVNWEDLLKELCAKRNLGDIEIKNYPVDEIVKGRCLIDSYEKEYRQQKETDISKLKTEIKQFTDRQKIKIFQKPFKYISKDVDLPNSFYHDMRSILYANTHSSKLIESIANLITKCKIESVITYNYDDLVEQEINNNQNKYHIKCRPIYDKSGPIEDGIRYIYHVHGFLSNGPEKSEKIILGEKEYHKVYQDSYNWSNVEQLHALNRSTCFFIGLSMTDPNLRRLMDISFADSDKEFVHYAFLCKKDHDISLTNTIMGDFGVNCIWYDEHEDLPGLLNSLLRETN